MAELHRLTVKIDADVDAVNRSMNDAAKQVNNFSRKMDGTVALAAQRAREAAQAAAAAMEQQYQKDMARIKEGQARGFLTAAEARKAGAEAAQAYNAGVIGVMDKAALTPGALSGKTGSAAVTQLAGSLKQVDIASQGAARGMGRAGYAMTSLARQAAGAHPATAQLSYALGGMALGSGVMVGVMAGAAAIGYAWRKMTADARDLKKAAEDAATAVAKVARDRDTGGLTDQIGRVDALGKEYGRLTKQIDRMKATEFTPTPDAEGDRARQQVHAAKLLELEQERARVYASFQEALRQYSDANTERADRERKAEEARLEAARRAAEEARRAAEEVRRSRLVSPGWEPAMSTLKRVVEALDAARAKIRDLEFQQGLPQTTGAAEQLQKAIADTHREVAALEAAFGSMGETAVRAMLGIKAGVIPIDPAGRAKSGTGADARVAQIGGGKLPEIQRAADSVIATSIAQATASAQLTDGLFQLSQATASTGTAMGNLVSNMFNFAAQLRAGQMSTGGLIGMGIGIFFQAVNLLTRKTDTSNRHLASIDRTMAKVADSLSNTPLSYNANLARHRINSASSTTIGTVVFQVDSASTWDTVKRQMTTAASRGDPVARRLVLQTAPGS
jgi:hypothetical protein